MEKIRDAFQPDPGRGSICTDCRFQLLGGKNPCRVRRILGPSTVDLVRYQVGTKIEEECSDSSSKRKSLGLIRMLSLNELAIIVQTQKADAEGGKVPA